MKTLLTGGAGYIGSHTAVAMLEAGHETAVVDNFYNSSPEAIRRVEQITGKQVRLYEADVADREKMTDILRTEMPDCIIHFAGLKAVGESVEKPVEYYRNNIGNWDLPILSFPVLRLFTAKTIYRLLPRQCLREPAPIRTDGPNGCRSRY